jgi:hypothetical protein
VNVETKGQLKQWMHTYSPNKPRKFKQTLSTRKAMVTLFCKRKGVLMIKLMQQGTMTTSEVYCKTLNKLLLAIEKKRHGMLTSGVELLHDNVSPYRTACTRALLEHFKWELFVHPPYSPDLAPRDYHLFAYPKNWLGS